MTRKLESHLFIEASVFRTLWYKMTPCSNVLGDGICVIDQGRDLITSKYLIPSISVTLWHVMVVRPQVLSMKVRRGFLIHEFGYSPVD